MSPATRYNDGEPGRAIESKYGSRVHTFTSTQGCGYEQPAHLIRTMVCSNASALCRARSDHSTICMHWGTNCDGSCCRTQPPLESEIFVGHWDGRVSAKTSAYIEANASGASLPFRCAPRQACASQLFTRAKSRDTFALLATIGTPRWALTPLTRWLDTS